MSDLVTAILTLGACVFAASAGSKLRGRAALGSFLAGLRATALVPGRRLRSVAVLLVAAETAVAAGLATSAAAVAARMPGAIPLAGSALAAAASLAAVLAAGVAIVIRRGTRARCTCFGGAAHRPLGIAHLIRNACLCIAFCTGTGLIAGPAGHDRPDQAAAIVAVLAGAVAALLVIRWEDLADLFAPIR